MIPGFRRSPGEGHGNPLPVLEKSCGERGLAGYSPKVCGESDTTEQLSTHTHTHTHTHTLSVTPTVVPCTSSFYILKCTILSDAPTHLKQEAGNISAALSHLFLGLLA